MATIQGICKNCGSLIMFDDRDETCECVFCNCVFPSSEAVEILNNPDAYSFENKEYAPSTDSRKHTTTKVYSDEGLQKAIKREDLAAAQRKESAATSNEFEISAKDVKAPAKVVSLVVGAIALFVILVVVISLPLYNSRKAFEDKIEAKIDTIYVYDNDLGHIVWGQTCENAKFVTSDSVSEEAAIEMFNSYCSIRNEAGNNTKDKDVTIQIYAHNGIWTVTSSGAENTQDAEYDKPAIETDAAE